MILDVCVYFRLNPPNGIWAHEDTCLRTMSVLVKSGCDVTAFGSASCDDLQCDDVIPFVVSKTCPESDVTVTNETEAMFICKKSTTG